LTPRSCPRKRPPTTATSIPSRTCAPARRGRRFRRRRDASAAGVCPQPWRKRCVMRLGPDAFDRSQTLTHPAYNVPSSTGPNLPAAGEGRGHSWRNDLLARRESHGLQASVHCEPRAGAYYYGLVEAGEISGKQAKDLSRGPEGASSRRARSSTRRGLSSLSDSVGARSLCSRIDREIPSQGGWSLPCGAEEGCGLLRRPGHERDGGAANPEAAGTNCARKCWRSVGTATPSAQNPRFRSRLG